MKPALVCLVDTPLLTIYHDVANGWLYNHWKGTHDATTIYTCAPYILAALDATGCRKVLSDHGELSGNWVQIAPRLGREAFAQLAARGVRAVAWVHSQDYHDQMAMYLAQRATTCPDIAIFDDVATACFWLQQRH